LVSPAEKPEFRIRPSESVRAELFRVAAAEIDFALALMRAIESDTVRAIHQFRKSMKRLRALVRLAAISGPSGWRELDRIFRDAARSLAPLRDETAVAAALKSLTADADVTHLLSGSSRPTADDRSLHAAAREAAAKLEPARALLRVFFEREDDWSMPAIIGSIELVYENGAFKMQLFRRHEYESFAHDWRKEVQRHANQLHLVAGCLAADADGRLSDLGTLARSLGDHHDFAVLETLIESHPSYPDGNSLAELAQKAREAQSELRKRALAIGAALFDPSPEVFVDHLSGSSPLPMQRSTLAGPHA
jgi:CHAD domain-containing protein